MFYNRHNKSKFSELLPQNSQYQSEIERIYFKHKDIYNAIVKTLIN